MKCRKKKPAEKQNVAFFVVVVGDKNWRVVVELREEFEYEKKVVHEGVKTKFTIGRESQSSFLQRLFSLGNPHLIFPISLYFFSVISMDIFMVFKLCYSKI